MNEREERWVKADIAAHSRRKDAGSAGGHGETPIRKWRTFCTTLRMDIDDTFECIANRNESARTWVAIWCGIFPCWCIRLCSWRSHSGGNERNKYTLEILDRALHVL